MNSISGLLKTSYIFILFMFLLVVGIGFNASSKIFKTSSKNMANVQKIDVVKFDFSQKLEIAYGGVKASPTTQEEGALESYKKYLLEFENSIKTMKDLEAFESLTSISKDIQRDSYTFITSAKKVIENAEMFNQYEAKRILEDEVLKSYSQIKDGFTILTMGIDSMLQESNKILSKTYDSSTLWISISLGFIVLLLLVILVRTNKILEKILFTPLRQVNESLIDLISDLSGGAKKTKQINNSEISKSPEVSKIFVSLKKLQEVSVQAFVVKHGLDHSESAVTLLDEFGSVLYRNESGDSLFDDLGTKDTSNLKDILDNASDIIKSNIPLNGEVVINKHTISYKTFPIMSDKKVENIGVEWRDITDERRVQDEIETLISRASKGHFDGRLNSETNQPFLKMLSTQLNAFLETLLSSMTDVKDVAQSLADGDFTREFDNKYEGTLGEVGDALNSTIMNLNGTIVKMSQIEKALDNARKSVTDGTGKLSERTQSQSGNLEEIAASMEEIVGTVKVSAENSQVATDVAKDASLKASLGREVVGKAVQAMSNIEESAEQISSITSMIDEIAFQTNLLALNASVEAARAGDSGKGFMVVAEEVRSLAHRAADASKDIRNLVTRTTEQIQEGASLVRDADGKLDEINESSDQVGSLISEVASATNEQSIGLDSINSSLTHMDEIARQNASLVEDSNRTVVDLGNQVQQLSGIIKGFKVNGSSDFA